MSQVKAVVFFPEPYRGQRIIDIVQAVANQMTYEAQFHRDSKRRIGQTSLWLEHHLMVVPELPGDTFEPDGLYDKVHVVHCRWPGMVSTDEVDPQVAQAAVQAFAHRLQDMLF